MDGRRLDIYLNDHLAGSSFGLDLARRAARSNQGTELGAFLGRLAGDIAEDREALIRLMHELGIPRSQPKTAAGWLLEKVSRLKLNGRLVGSARLTRLLELEALTLGVTGKLELWQALEHIGLRAESVDIGELVRRATGQREELVRRRLEAAAEALGADEAGASRQPAERST